MLDVNIVNIARKRIMLEIEDQSIFLRDQIDRVKAEMSAKGILGSGATVRRIIDLCSQSIRNRAQLVWQTLFRFITTSGVSYSDDLSSELKNIVAAYLPESLNNFRDIIERNIPRTSVETISRLMEDLSVARAHALNTISTEIDLFVHSLKKKSQIIEGDKKATIVNIYSPVGSIQTGDNAIANVTQIIDSDLRQQFASVLNSISEGLSSLESLPTFPKNEIEELIIDGQSELKREKPNSTKLRSIFSTIGASIQTVASLKPAYDTLKQLLTYLGVSLP